MDVAATLTSKGQIIVPKRVREALGLHSGDQVIFRVSENHAVIAKTRNFLDLAGSVVTPADKQHVSWEEVRNQAWQKRGHELDG